MNEIEKLARKMHDKHTGGLKWEHTAKLAQNDYKILAKEILELGFLPVEEVTLEGLTEDEIDNLRLQTIKDMVADHTWWDMCAAFEKMYGVDAVILAEQILIDITNKTGIEASRATLSNIQ